MNIRYLTIGKLSNDDSNKSLWVVVPATDEQIGELVTWLENWYCVM